jgi:hypothetical protein
VTFDGWYLDDVWIGESELTFSYPFFDSMDEAESESNWLASSWGRVSPGYSGNYCFNDSPKGKVHNLGRTSMAMAGSDGCGSTAACLLASLLPGIPG